ncbi:ATP synthase subunit C [Treponema sp.]|uniref:ATP synthase subunit C n=1 Tax=Treponema sp. TaxID=166 RepID=UPI003F0FBCF6
MNKRFFVVFSMVLMVSIAGVFAQDASVPADEQAVEQAASNTGSAVKYVAAAIAVGIACIGGGSAVGKIGSAAMGAMSENAELSGKALPFVGLAEGICLWGFLVALFIMIM